MSDLRLTLAMSDYLHVNDLIAGHVKPVGIDLTVLKLPFEQAAIRFVRNLEWEVSEYSLAGYCAAVSQPEPAPFVALPIFPSRVFRQSSIYIRADAGISSAKDLAGRRVGIPQWTQTALIYVRGWLQHTAGVPLSDIRWVQAGLQMPGRMDHAEFHLPAGVEIEARPDCTLDNLLLEGDIDAVITARPPPAFLSGNPAIRRLFEDHVAEERRQFELNGVVPIMHVVVVRRDAYEANRWIMRNLFEAFEEAKRNAFARLADPTTSFLPMTWGSETVLSANRALFGSGTPWPYGIEPNRKTLEAFLTYSFEQGVTARQLSVDELFPASLLEDVPV